MWKKFECGDQCNNVMYLFDTNTYLTVIFGLITILGILIAFYQFLSAQKTGSYLRINRVKYLFLLNGYVKLFYYKCVIWMIVCGWPIAQLCEQIKLIPGGFSWGNWLCEVCSGLSILLWMLALAVFIIYMIHILLSYVMQLVNIASHALSLDEFAPHEIDKLDQSFIRRHTREHHNKCTIDCFHDMIKELDGYEEKNSGKKCQYIGLKKKLVRIYIEQKNKVDTTGWKYIEEQELQAFKSLVRALGKGESDEFRYFILEQIVQCIKEDLKIAQYNQVGNKELSLEENCDRIFRDNDWKQLILNVYQYLELDKKVKFIESLLYWNDDSSYQELAKRLLRDLLNSDSRGLIINQLSDRDFIKIWSSCLQRKEYNNLYKQRLYEHLCSGEGGRGSSTCVELLDQENKALVLMNLIFYYSIYTGIGRCEWLNLDIEVMKSLYDEKHIDVYEREEEVKKQIKNSNYAHRLNQYELDELYDVFLEVWKQPLSAQLLEKIYSCTGLNAYYILVLKICVQRGSWRYIGKIANEVFVDILNGANRHLEIWKTYDMQCALFSMEPANKIDMSLPYELEISLEVLVKLNIPLDKIKEDSRIVNLHDVIFGQYVLAKCVLDGKTDDMNIALWKESIKRSYYRSNKEMEMYCNEIFEAYETIGQKVWYAQKDDMKRLLYECCH